MNQQVLTQWVADLNLNVIGPLLSVLLIGTGLYYTVRLGFIQRYFFFGLKRIFHSDKGVKTSRKDGMTPFQALTTAVASQVGTGNIVGVATALFAGGPGALFWLWVSTFIGMATNFGEAVLGQLYRTEKDGHAVGGPAFYIHKGLGSKALAVVFSIFFILALGVMGIMVQANSIAESMTSLLPESVSPIYIGIALAILTGGVLSGGMTRIASFSERIVPVMACLFVLGSTIFICMHIQQVPAVLSDVVRYTFEPWSIGGGILGSSVMATMRYGVSRGLFSNEAGLGSSPHAHALAQVKKPSDQGLIAIVGIGVDLVICTLTALVILLSGVMQSDPSAQGVEIAQKAFGSSFGSLGNIFISVALLFFAFSTIVGWYFFAAQNVRYLFGERLVWPYRIVVMLVVVLASVVQATLVWELADTFNCFLIIPNVIALIYLAPKVVQEARRIKEKD